MTFVVPPVLNHRELSPEEVNEARIAVAKHLKASGIDLGITTAIALTIYDAEVTNQKHIELRGTTNPKLKRFKVPVRFKDGRVHVLADELEIRPPYDSRRARGRTDRP